MRPILWCGISLVVCAAGCSKPATPPETATTPQASGAPHARASELGQRISREAFQLLSQNLRMAIQQGGATNALGYCSVAALPLTESVSQTYHATVRRVSHRPRNPKAAADPTELTVLQAFREALQMSTNTPPALTTNLQPQTITFFAPIVLNNPLCLQCHGSPDSDIQPATQALSRQLYPHDQATGFKLGELRGAWRIDFPKQALTDAAVR